MVVRMVQEDQQRYSNSSGGSGGGGRVSKKVKQKKIPQRGLGVAQLERIRIEELQKKNEAAGPPGAVVGSSPVLFLPLNKHHYNLPSTSIPPPPGFKPNFRPNFEAFRQFPPVPPPSHGISYGNTSSRAGVGVGYFPNAASSSEFSHDREGSKLNPGYMLQHVGPSSNVMQKHYLSQQENQSSKVNPSSSSSFSSGHSTQIEPPSNQSYHSNNYRTPPWPEDDKMVGIKRSWPFSQEKPPNPSPRGSYPQFAPPISRFDERPSHENGGRLSFESGNSIYRESASGSAAHQYEWKAGTPELNIKNGSKENESPDTALTLSLPTPSSSSNTSKGKQSLEFPVSSHQELSNSIASTHQEYTGGSFLPQRESVQPQPVYSFFPLRMSQNGHLATNSGDRRTEINEPLDLNLKL